MNTKFHNRIGKEMEDFFNFVNSEDPDTLNDRTYLYSFNQSSTRVSKLINCNENFKI